LGKVELEYFEDKFLKKNSLQYELSILIGVDSLCYAVATPSAELLGLRKYAYLQPPASFRDLAGPVSQILQVDPLLRKPFGKVRIGLLHPYISLVPQRLYNREEQRAYLEKLLELQTQDRFRTDVLPFTDAMGIYPVDAALAEELDRAYPQAALCHAASALAIDLAPRFLTEGPKRLFFNLRDGSVQVFAFEADKLLLLNAFPFTGPTDVAYFLLLVCKQLSWDPEQVPLYAMGMLVEDSAIFRNLQRFFPILRFAERQDAEVVLGPRLQQGIRKYWFADLFSLWKQP
jgi:hypothetical protein